MEATNQVATSFTIKSLIKRQNNDGNKKFARRFEYLIKTCQLRIAGIYSSLLQSAWLWYNICSLIGNVQNPSLYNLQSNNFKSIPLAFLS